ncbi:MAG: threonine-phosphate decarboxylase CobD [Sneathiella sp.]
MIYPSATYNRDLLHGGDLDLAQKNFGGEISDWIDLSTGINPVPYVIPDLPPALWSRLPGSALEQSLIQAARRYYSIPEAYDCVAGPGTQALIQLLPRLYTPSDVAIFGPTYAEHEHCWRGAGHRTKMVASLSDILPAARIIILVSPDNPTGSIASGSDLLALQQMVRARNGLLVIDEAFMDGFPEQSALSALTPDHLILLKSFGKFFGLAGLRLGFAMGDKQTIPKLKKQLGPWAVSGPAAYIGQEAYQNTNWIHQTRQRLKQEMTRLSELLGKAGADLVGETDLFTLVKHEKSAVLYQHLCQNQILTRPFSHDPALLRFGHPANERQWTKLQNALRAF